MDVEKARQFLTNKGWDKTNPTVGGVFFEGIAELLAEYEAKVIVVQPDVSGQVCPKCNVVMEGATYKGCKMCHVCREWQTLR